ncbi:MAG: hypothetical protein WCS30_14045 [Selenomonadaceae bacterium]
MGIGMTYTTMAAEAAFKKFNSYCEGWRAGKCGEYHFKVKFGNDGKIERMEVYDHCKWKVAEIRGKKDRKWWIDEDETVDLEPVIAAAMKKR